ncbi:40S ribosomal protein S15-3 [Dictyocoela muelleri]|nr:40S ribosomal protein S15-3 [Dictyocoela muelleri]
MADDETRRKRTFKKFQFRGVELEDLLKMPLSQFKHLLNSSLRRRINRGLTQTEVDLIKKCQEVQSLKNKSSFTADDELPEIKTMIRSLPILPVMIGLTIKVYNGSTYQPLEVKPEMIGHRLQDYVVTKNVCKHGAPGVGATASSKFVPLK